MKRRENADSQSQQRQHQKDPGPELSFINALGVRITWVKPGIEVVPEVRALALGAELMKSLVLVTASRAGKRD
ncbi:MAG: hypothetical protein M0Q91_06390 [Methanoregula sp.]|nr:hypothetical protein [Methanoregula sp.]